MIRLLSVALATLPLCLPLACLSAVHAKETGSDASSTLPRDNVIARVGDQPITFSQLNTMLNSSAIVGLSIPALGTPERDQTRLTLLDKVISANLLYLDALKQGVDEDPSYQQNLLRFSDGMLALVYRRRHYGDLIDVTEEEVQAFFDDNIAPGTELTDEVKMAIESKLRKRKLTGSADKIRTRLREGLAVSIHVTELDPEDDPVRLDAEVVAEIDGQPVRWGEVKGLLGRPLASSSVQRRIEAMEDAIDQHIMIARAREAGLDKDPAYLKPFNEFKKVRLINLHRGKLVKRFEPSDGEIRAYYEANRDRIRVPERRRVQIVVLKSKEEAEAVKKMVEAGTITLHRAAKEHSVVPASDKTLGEIGWVSEGTGFPGLDELTFSLDPDEIGGPVETPNGWHLVRVLDVEDAVYDDIDDRRTWKMTRRRIIKERLDEYVVSLRTNDFPVVVYDDKLSYHMQKEVDWYKIRAETGTQPPEKIYEEIEKLRGGKAPTLGQ